MRRLRPTLAAMIVAAGIVSWATPASAHPTPFSYVDLELGNRAVDVTIVAHVFDLAHDLGTDSARLLDPALAPANASAVAALLRPRVQIDADGQPLICAPANGLEVVTERDSLKLRFVCPVDHSAGVVTIQTLMFPYDPSHQTFVNVYERGMLASQAIIDRGRTAFDYFTGTRQGTLAVVRKFVPAGVHHILIGPDHLLFLIGLLLLGGSVRRLLIVVTAFTIAHSITLSVAALSLVSPPARIVEPAIALSIVYVGADNLLVRGGRDVRAWIALTFGLIHGFGFANVLREMDLPARALGWSLFSFNLGVEIGQLVVVAAVASAIAALWSRSEAAGRRLAFAGSLVVIATGAFWFVQRVFFPGGMS
jgi:hydrogenase/urease accessory protein HupE